MRKRTKAVRLDPLMVTAGMLVGVLVYVVVRKYGEGTLPAPFDDFISTLIR